MWQWWSCRMQQFTSWLINNGNQSSTSAEQKEMSIRNSQNFKDEEKDKQKGKDRCKPRLVFGKPRYWVTDKSKEAHKNENKNGGMHYN